MNAHSKSLLSIGGLLAALAIPAGTSLAVTLDYTFTGQFFAGSLLNGTLLDGSDFEVHITTDTTVPDNDPGDVERGEFVGPFSAQLSIEGLGVYSFVNPIATITEWIDAPGFQPVESRASFGGGSTSSMTAFSPNTISPFFGDPNLLDAFAGGANVVVADFNGEPVILLGGTEVLSLDAQSPGGTVSATPVPDSGSALLIFSLVAAGLVTWQRRRSS